jgi:small subunit ribosomal protein S6
VSNAQVEAMAEEFGKVITEAGGKLGKREFWGLRNLAYRIKKNRKGHYVLTQFEAPTGAVQEMERLMRLNEDTLRHLTIRIEELDEQPSPMMKSRRDDRGERGGRGRGRRDDDRRDGDRKPAAERSGDNKSGDSKSGEGDN